VTLEDKEVTRCDITGDFNYLDLMQNIGRRNINPILRQILLRPIMRQQTRRLRIVQPINIPLMIPIRHR